MTHLCPFGLHGKSEGQIVKPRQQRHFGDPWTEMMAQQMPLKRGPGKQDKENSLHPTSQLPITAPCSDGT